LAYLKKIKINILKKLLDEIMWVFRKLCAELKIYNLLKKEYLRLDEANQGYVLFKRNELLYPNYKEKTITEICGDHNMARIIITEWLNNKIIEEGPHFLKPESDFFRLTSYGIRWENHPIIRRIKKFVNLIVNLLKIIFNF